MAFMSSDSSMNLPYSRENCFEAVKAAAKTLPKFKLKSENSMSGTLKFDVKAGMTSFTWGDIVSVTVGTTQNGLTPISISSTAKAPSLLAPAAENKNVDMLTEALSKELEKYPKIPSDAQAAESTQGSAADEIKKYKELLDIGAITEEEFSAKKKQLLGI